MLIGTGFPKAVDSADWRFRVDFRCGTVEIVGGVRFWFRLLGDGAMSSEDVDDCSSLSESLDVDFSRVLLLVDFSTLFSVCRLMSRVVCNLCIGRPPVRFPFDFAFFCRTILVCLACCLFLASYFYWQACCFGLPEHRVLRGSRVHNV